MRIPKQILTMASAIAILTSTHAASYAEDTRRLHDAWEDALEDMEGVLTPEQTAVVHHLAYQAAVARVCDGFAVNHQKYADEINAIVASNSEALDTAQFMTRHTDIVMKLGTAYGLFLAEGNQQKENFCNAATEARKDTAVQWIWE